MVILDKLDPVHYFLFTIDFIVIFIFFYVSLKNIQTMRIMGLFKALMFVIVFWFVSRVAGLEMATQVFGVMLSYSFLAVILMFPDEFKKMLDNFGRKDIVQWNKYKLISKDSIHELAGAMMELSRRREGAYIIIARKSDLEEEINDGERIGSLSINKNVITELLKENSHFSKGAMIIRDNEIASMNVLTNMTNYSDLVRKGAGKRHLGAFWVASERDCIALVVSGTTGRITIASTEKKDLKYTYSLPTKETDITNGLDVDSLAAMIEGRLTGKNIEVEERNEKGKKKTKKKKEKTKKENKKSKKDVKEERQKKRNNRKDDKEDVSKGFGNR